MSGDPEVLGAGAPLTADEERRWRRYIEAACRETVVVRGGMFDMSRRLLATLDTARDSRPVGEAVIRDLARRAGYVKAGEAMIRVLQAGPAAVRPVEREGLRHDPADHDCRGGVPGDRFPL